MFFSSILVIAESEVVVTPIKNEITTKEQASFSLKITNKEDETQRYSLYSLQSGQGWNVDPSPLKDKIIELKPGQSYTTKIIAAPLEDFAAGIYNIYVTIQSDLGETYSKSLKIYLSPEGPVNYLPTIKVTVDMDEKIDPRDPISIKLFLENKNPLNLTGMKIKIQSDMPEFVKEVDVDIPPLEKKTVEFTVIPNEIQQPKEYTLFFVFERAGEIVKVIEKNIEIISLLPEFKVKVSQERSFLKKFKTLVVSNEGNVRNTQFVKLPISFWESLFTTSSANIKSEETGRYLSWEVSLGPNESTNLNTTTNYRILLYLLIAALFIIGFYLYVQSPISINKTAVTTKSAESGALSEIKITLELKNRSKKPIKDVMITDLVPGIADVEKSLELGTLKPKEIKHANTGTKVIWSLAELDVGEHRLITYKVKAKLNILGTFSLPRAIVEFKKKGKTNKSYSNTFQISS